MAYVADFRQVQTFLASRGAQLVKRSGQGDVYVASNGTYIRVARQGAGFDVATFANRADCGCG